MTLLHALRTQKGFLWLSGGAPVRSCSAQLAAVLASAPDSAPDTEAILGLLRERADAAMEGLVRHLQRELDAGLRDLPELMLPSTRNGLKHAYHLYPVVVRTEALTAVATRWRRGSPAPSGCCSKNTCTCSTPWAREKCCTRARES